MKSANHDGLSRSALSEFASLYFEVGNQVKGKLGDKIPLNRGPWFEDSYKQKVQQPHRIKMDEGV